jgi:hypothetical protein
MTPLAAFGVAALAVAFAVTHRQLRAEQAHAATLRNAVALGRFARRDP